MTWPPQYPRVPHLSPAREAARDDLVLDEAATRKLLDQPVVVEEKLDGASVTLWLEEGLLCVASRGGVGAMDRGGQLGPLRAWAAARLPQLVPLLGDDRVLYAEWLWLRHGVSYDSLPSHLIALDLFSPNGFATLAERDSALAAAGLVAPPRLLEGSGLSRAAIQGSIGISAFGSQPAEGVVVRAVHAWDGPRLAKAVSSSFEPRGNEDWRTSRERNLMAS